MSLNIDSLGPSAIEIEITGKLVKEDYESFVPWAERIVNAGGKVGLLLRVADFEGWSLGGLWEDLKFDVRHYKDISRLAFVGDEASQEWMARVSRPFTTAEVRYFSEADLDAARRWVREAKAH